jgi:hypothetical protein
VIANDSVIAGFRVRADVRRAPACKFEATGQIPRKGEQREADWPACSHILEEIN